jgi:hypothetical protein
MSHQLDPRYYFQEARRLYQHKQEYYGHLLSLAVKCHRAGAIGHLVAGWIMSMSSAARLDVLAILLSTCSSIVWLSVLKNPNQFWGFHRPERSYFLAVYTATAGGIMSTLMVDVLIVIKSWKFKTGVDFWYSIWQLLLWTGISASCVWMVNKFLGGEKEDTLYEPVTTSTLSFLVDAVEPYSDLPYAPTSHDLGASQLGLLSAAYRTQRSDGHIQRQATRNTPANVAVATIEPFEAPPSASPRPAHSSLCPTLARYDYMTQSRIGPHSWICLPLVSLGLGLYGTFNMAVVAAFMHENNRVRIPYQNVKRLWYWPLSILLFCLYSRKHRLRASLFTHYKMQFPGPWKWKEVSILPVKPVFKNIDTGAYSPLDPRLRAFPSMKDGGTAALQSRAYISAYNANACLCTEYWGHLGRQWNNTFRVRAVTNRLGFLGFSSYLGLKGCWTMFGLSATMLQKAHMQLPDITVGDLERVIRLFRVQMALMIVTSPVILISILYTLAAMSSLFTFWGKSALALEKEERELREAGLRARQQRDTNCSE